MLKSLDVLIGFAVVMLVGSMAVTMLVQMVLAAVNLRGRSLLNGLSTLLHQLDPEKLPLADARKLAERVLLHPRVQSPSGRYGGVVQREELVEILMELAAGAVPPARPAAVGGGAAVQPALVASASPAVNALAKLLEANGITDPISALRAIRQKAAALEAEHPGWAAHVRQATAVIQSTQGEWVPKINAWFDHSMERVSQTFLFRTRVVTAMVAVLFACGLQIDAFGLINRLAVDPQVLSSLLQQAGTTQATAMPKEQIHSLTQLASAGLIVVPDVHWLDSWNTHQVNLLGVLVTAILLSLGAPFWFGLLQDLLKLRPKLAAIEDDQRKQRQTEQPEA